MMQQSEWKLKRRRKCASGRRPLKLVDFAREEKGFCLLQARRQQGFRGRGSKNLSFEQGFLPRERTLKRYKRYSRQQIDHESEGENDFPCPSYQLVMEMHKSVKHSSTGSLKRTMHAGPEEDALGSPAHDIYSIHAVRDAIHDLQDHITAGQYSAAIKKAEHSSVWRKAFTMTHKIEWKIQMISASESKLH